MLDEALSCNIIQHNAETVKQSKQRIIERNPPRKNIIITIMINVIASQSLHEPIYMRTARILMWA